MLKFYLIKCDEKFVNDVQFSVEPETATGTVNLFNKKCSYFRLFKKEWI
jgi:hypothetical protein